MTRYLLRLFLLLSVSLSRAQTDSTIWLKPINIKAERFEFSDPGIKLQYLDTSKISRLTGNTLADRFDREAGIFMKSYGTGSLSTVSLRGAGAAHTAVSWNGLSLNSPMLGIYDFSLLPVYLLDDIHIQNGGNGPLAGSGSVSGAIFLNSKQEIKRIFTADVLTGAGSFGNRQLGAGIKLGTAHFVSNTRIYTQRANNNFSFINPEGEFRKQLHARFNQYGITEDIGIGTATNRIDLHFWYLENEREIPPHMLAQISEQEQKDKSLRVAGEWSGFENDWFWNFSAGLNREQIRYTDPQARLDEISNATTYQTTAELGHLFSQKFKLVSQIAGLRGEAMCEGYEKDRGQEQWSLGLKGVFETQNIYINASIRQGWFDRTSIPFLPALNFRYTLTRGLYWKGDISRVYRVPTLNDRYWVPGGNEELQPEQGISSSTGMQWSVSQGKWNASAQATIFYAQLRKAIVWLPQLNGLYSAENVHEIISQGFEGESNVAYATGKWKFRSGFTAAVVSAEIASSAPAFAAGIGKQMIYTPRLMYKSQFEITYTSITIRYYHNYTGHRYTTIDHAHYLEPFNVAEAVLAWTGSTPYGSITATLNVKNLYKENYQVIAWRAMPGRSIHAGLFITFGK